MKNLKEIKEMVDDLKEKYLNVGFVSALEFDNRMNTEGFYGSLFDDSGYLSFGNFTYQSKDIPPDLDDNVIEVSVYFDEVKGDDEEPRTVLFKIWDIEINN